MDPVMLGVMAAIVIGGLFVGALVLWWTVKAAVSMLKRALALAFVLGLTGLLLAAAGVAFVAAHHH